MVTPATVRVPVKFAVLDMVCPLMRPEVIGPALSDEAESEPMLPFVLKRFVDEAIELKREVVVAEVPVALLKLVRPRLETLENKFWLNKAVVVALVPVPFTKVKFCRVVEPVRRRFEAVMPALKAIKVLVAFEGKR